MTTATVREVKSFKDVPSMWYGFAGAECWPNGDEPVYCEVNDHLIIADNGQVGIYTDNGDNDQGMLSIPDLTFPNQKCAIAFLTGLPDDFNPVDFGAKPF